MRPTDIERTMELLHEHINGVERAQLVADRVLEEQLSEQVSQLRGLVVRLTNMIVEALEINNGTSVDGFDTETVPWNWGHLGDNDTRLFAILWEQHLKAIDEATDAGDFLTERVLAEMRDSARACLKTIAKSYREYKEGSDG